MKILIAGDLLPTKDNQTAFENGDLSNICDSKINDLLRRADYRVCNLEGPLTECTETIPKSGPSLKTSSKSINGIKALGIDLVSLANNHIMDFGSEGYYSTIKNLNEYNIRYVGSGNNLQSVHKSYLIDFEDIKVGVYACAEHEFTIATENNPGANPFDLLEVLDDISELKKEVNYLIVLYHGGKEFYRYPVPYLQKRCRKLIEKGADIVLCQHSHCIGAQERYIHGNILYGQGNFIFNYGEDNEFVHSGMLVAIELTEKEYTIEYIPVVRDNNIVRMPDDIEKKEILNAFEVRNREIKEAGFIQKKYEEYAEQMLDYYYQCSLGNIGNFFRKLHLNNIMNRCFKKHHRLTLLNALRCEAHRDLFIEGIKK